jgi:predicted RecB family nuclease
VVIDRVRAEPVSGYPSGAASIEWFDQWIKTGDPAIRQRILDYNEDDCRPTRVLLDGIRGLSER